MIIMFKVGITKLVCIEKFDGSYFKTGARDNGPCPHVNEIYTYDGMSPSGIGYFLTELNYISAYGSRVSFVCYKFRPLDEVLSEIGLNEVAEILEQETITTQLV